MLLWCIRETAHPYTKIPLKLAGQQGSVMSIGLAEQELFHACQILFGSELDVGRDFLEYLQPSGIKTAYRKKARETHPDTAAARGEIACRRHAAEFQNVQQAYEHLSRYLEAREKGFRFRGRAAARNRWAARKQQEQTRKNARPASSSAYRTGSSTRNRTSHHQNPHGKTRQQANYTRQQHSSYSGVYRNLYQGSIPERRMRLGHFMYYSGLIDWRTIIQALVWQRTHRPRLGEIGCRMGWLTEDDVRLILKNRKFMEPFGETAVNLRMLTRNQLVTMIRYQKYLQKKFGQFFVENRLLTAEQLRRVLARYSEHNARMAEASRRTGASK